LPGTAPLSTPEYTIEVSQVVEAAGETNSRDAVIRFSKETFGFFDAQRLDVFGESHPALFQLDRFHFFQRNLTMAAFLHDMSFEMVWMLYHFQRAARMSRLPSAFLATLVPQALGLFRQSVARGWFPTVAAVLCQPIFLCLEPFCHLLKGFVKQGHHCLFPLLVSGVNFFTVRQFQRFHSLSFTGFCVFDNPYFASTFSSYVFSYKDRRTLKER
jgi:hypothetical protein